eukprot:317953-Chlamydomonas_euryale.AAC.2
MSVASATPPKTTTFPRLNPPTTTPLVDSAARIVPVPTHSDRLGRKNRASTHTLGSTRPQASCQYPHTRIDSAARIVPQTHTF